MSCAYTKFLDHATAKGMDILELMEWVDQFRWFPRSDRHCPTTYRGRNLKKYGHYGFFELGTTYNMDTVYRYVYEHELSLFEFLNELDEIATLMDTWRLECAEAEWQERLHAA